MGFKLTSPPLLLLRKSGPANEISAGQRWNARTIWSQMKCKDPLHSVQVCWHANMDIKNICNLGPIKPPKGPKWRSTNPNITLSKASLSLWVQKSAQSDNINAMQSYTSWGNKMYFCCNITGCVPWNYFLMTAEQLWVNRLQKMVMLMTQTQMLSQSVEMETLDLEKYLLYLCEWNSYFAMCSATLRW